MGIKKYVITRVLVAVPLIMVAVIINFLIMHTAPGSPVDFILAAEEIHYLTPEMIALLEETYGLNKPLSEQLMIYISKMLKGDFGYSYQYHRPVFDLIYSRLGITLLLTIPSFVCSMASISL